jgi:cell division septation protein DedD
MASSQDTEITLGTGKLLGLFFGLVIVCAVFFSFGYMLGRKTDAGLSGTVANPATPALNGAKPASSAASSSSTTPMTFYKAVEQQNANPQLTPAASVSGTPEGNSAGTASEPATGAASKDASNPPDPMAPIPGTGYFVQVAAVSKQDDAAALVDALKKKLYPAFVASNSTADKLFRVQVGPFGDIKEAEAMRARLVNDGYSPILKK